MAGIPSLDDIVPQAGVGPSLDDIVPVGEGRRATQYDSQSVAEIKALPAITGTPMQRLNAKLETQRSNRAASKGVQTAERVTDQYEKTKAPEAGDNYLVAKGKSGLSSLASVFAGLVNDINPYTTSDADLAVLYQNDARGLEEARNSSVGFLGRLARNLNDTSERQGANISFGDESKYETLSYATLDPKSAAYLSPTRVLGDAIQSLPTTVALALTAALTRGASLRAESAALVAGVSQAEARAIGIKAAEHMAERFGAASEGLTGYEQQRVSTQSQYEKADVTSFPEYQELVKQGYDPSAAKLFVAARAGQKAGIGAGVVDAATNLVGGHFLGKIIGEGGDIGKRALKGAANEGATEFVQSAGEQASANLASPDPTTKIVDGVLENAVQGLAVGGLTGAGAAAAAGGPARAPVAPVAPRIQDIPDAAVLTPEDDASPIPNSVIAKGRKSGGGVLAPDAIPTTETASAVIDHFVQRASAVESGNNATAKNPTSSATGAHQFVKGTWLSLMKSTRPQQVAGKTDEQILAMRNNPLISAQMAAVYARQNGDALAKRGNPVDEGSLYLSHFLGSGGANAVLSADPNTPVERILQPGQINANKSILAGKTAADVISWAYGKMGKAPGAAPSTPGFTPQTTEDQIESAQSFITRILGDEQGNGGDVSLEQADDSQDTGALPEGGATVPAVDTADASQPLSAFQGIEQAPATEPSLIAPAAAPTEQVIAVPSGTPRPTEQVNSNVPQSAAADEGIGPASVLSMQRSGTPGVSVERDGDDMATAVWRDDQGVPRGAVQLPLSEEARSIYDGVSSFVDPQYRRRGIATQLYAALADQGLPIDTDSGAGDLTPDGAALVNARRGASVPTLDELIPATNLPTKAAYGAPTRGAPRQRNGPVDALTFIADRGGLRDDEGHNLRKRGREMGQYAPGGGHLFRKRGMTIDQAGELLHEAGYFPGARPSEADVLDMLHRAESQRVYRPEDTAAMEERDTQGRGPGEDDVRAEIAQVADEYAEPLTPREVRHIMDLMADGTGAHEAFVRHFEMEAADVLAEAFQATSDPVYDIAEEEGDPGYDTENPPSDRTEIEAADPGIKPDVERRAPAEAAAQPSEPDRANPVESRKPPEPVASASTATVADMPSGKSVAIRGATPEQLATVRAALSDKVLPIAKPNGDVVYSKKHEAKIRAALDSAPEAQAPAEEQDDAPPELRATPEEREAMQPAKPEPVARDKPAKKLPMGDRNPLVRKGERFRFNERVGYLGGGSDTENDTYIADYGAEREVHFTNERTGGRSSIINFQIKNALHNRKMERIAAPAQADANDVPAELQAPAELKVTKSYLKATTPSRNKIFTDDAAERARATLREAFGRMNSGIDPTLAQAGITLAGYHIEKGARTFAAFSAAMIEDIGEKVRPYLRSWYEAIRYDPRMTDAAAEMTAPAEIDGAPTQEATAAPDQSGDLLDTFVKAFADGRKFASITEARSFAEKITGEKVAPGSAQAKALDEAIEEAVVQRARQIAGKGGESVYPDLVALYESQPKLSVRTSTSVEQQAYSTPVPLAYLASRLAGVDGSTTVYEPSAGNGALLIDARSTNIRANELNLDRAEAIGRIYSGAKVTTEDATEYLPSGKVDAVLANPPFGPVKDDNGQSVRFQVDGPYSTNEIDHAIAWQSLKAMKDNGRAVLIIGSIAKTAQSDKARSDGYNGKAKREFYYKLYGAYNVVDHFTVAGELYERQGAGWPVDVIVIEGRGKSALSLPAVNVPRQYASWETLQEVLSERGTAAIASTSKPDGSDTGERPVSTGPNDPNSQRSRGSGLDGRDGIGADEQPDVVRSRPSDGQPERAGMGEPEDGGPSAGADTVKQRPAGRDKPPVETAENERQVTYTPGSGAPAMGTLVPVNMQGAVNEALAALSSRVGDTDDYVAGKLGYTTDDLFGRFGGEQVDAIALAIDNIERGAGFIIGDQTGIGKGRVVAAVLRYAMRENRTPIFVTEKPNLYKDIYRDLMDIGVGDMLGREMNILMTDAAKTVPLDEDGKQLLRTPGAREHNAQLAEVAAKGLKASGHDILFTTYSQMQSLGGEETARQKAIRAIATGAVLALDESHNAGGQGPQIKPATKDGKAAAPSRAEFVREIVGLAHGVFYSSATYAKRPDVMDLYSATDMRLAVDDMSKLGDAINKGGVPLQQIVASMLARAGQYLRRERSFDGIAYNTPRVPVDTQKYEAASAILKAIQEFSEDHIGDATEKLNDDLKSEAESVSADNSTGGAGASSTNFTAIMHNVIDQMLLAFKAQDAADRAIQAVSDGKKPVVTVANTLESMLTQYAEDAGVGNGQEINITFADVFRRYLERSRWVTVRKPFMEKGEKGERVRLTDAQIGASGVRAFNEAMAMINEAGLDSLPGSPIDYMIGRMKDAGLKVGEITGRTLGVNYRDGKAFLMSRGAADKSIAGRIEQIKGFNDGTLDVMVLNQAGATGLSLHASAKFKDQKPRKMIIAQPERNIDTHMQMLGRVHRTGQVVLPEYDQLVADIPAEKRPASVLAKKMASLNANTTGARDSAVTAKDVPDFMNLYGDTVAARIMAEEPELHTALGSPLNEDGEGYSVDGAMRKVTGRIPLLPLAAQEETYNRLETEYTDYLANKEAAGENALEAKTFPLDARTIDTFEALPAKAALASPFAAAVNVEKMSIKRLGKPYSTETVREMIADGKAELGSSMANSRSAGIAYLNAEIAKAKAETQAGIRKRLTENREAWDKVSQLVRIGEGVRLATDLGNLYGVVTSISQTGKPKNPLALGSWKVTVALVDASRQITLPFSMIAQDTGAPIEGGMIGVRPATKIGDFPVMDAFDRMQVDSREERHIVTGNILSGFDYMKSRGQIINFTDDKGAVRQGIMTPRGWSFEKHQARQGVPLTDARAIVDFLSTSIDGLKGKGSTGDIVLQLFPGRGQMIATAAKTKKAGGEFFLNRELTRALGTDFVSTSSGMVARARADAAGPVIEALLKSGTRFEVSGAASDEQKERARDLMKQYGTARFSRTAPPGGFDFDAPQPERTMTAAQRAELDARQQQQMARRGGQTGLGDQEGGLFSSERDQGALFSRTDTNAFRKWFGGSKVVDADGRPLRVFRGLNDEFIDGIEGAQFWTPDPAAASDYAEPMSGTDYEATSSNVVPAYLSIKNPFRLIDDAAARQLGEWTGQEWDYGPYYDMVMDPAVRTELMERGYDGIELPDSNGRVDHQTFVTFSPEQIKSASGNNGRFDPSDSRIAFSRTDGTDSADWRVLRSGLSERVAGLGLSDKVLVDVLNKITGDTNVAGMYDRGIITIAMDAAQSPEFTLDHEAIHALRDLGLFRSAEWSTLSQAAKADTALLDSVRLRYGAQGLDENGIIEEAVADMFARWRAGRPANGFMRTAFQRINDLFAAVRQLVTGSPRATDIMRAIDRGEVGNRVASESGGERKFSIPGPGDDINEPNRGVVDRALTAARSLIGNGENISERMDAWRTALQDRMLPLLRTQQRIELQTGRALPEQLNPYLSEELMTGKVGARMERFDSDHVRPLFDAMKAAKVSIADLESYLYARHAPERNARIAEINPNFEEGTGSGMTDAEATAIMERFNVEGRTSALESLAGRVDALLRFSIDTRVSGDLLSQDEAEAWGATYQHYVPLRGIEEVNPESGQSERPRRGSGINVRGKESRRAFGRESRAKNILAYSIMQAEEAIIRVGTNDVGKSFYELAKANPDPDFWTLTKSTKKPYFDKASGQVRYRIDNMLSAEDAPYTVSLKIDGQERRVTMNRDNPAAKRLADAMRNMNAGQLGSVLQVLGKFNRFLSFVNTAVNPEFIITNALRDMQTAGINLADRKGFVGKVARAYPGAMRGSMRGAFGKEDGEWGRWYREFVNNGGRVFFNQVDDLSGIQRRIERNFSSRSVGAEAALKSVLALRSFIEHANNGVENAVRLATYKVARESGLSEAQSASIAKNLTVNFNRRGALGSIMNSAYLFFNASMQGTARIFQAMGSKRIRRVLYSAIVAGALLDMLNRLLTGTDDDGEDYYDKISDFDKSRNLIVMIPGGKGEHIKIPLPYGYNVFYALGRAPVEIANGKKVGEVGSNLIGSIADAFNPIGGTNSILNFFAPTILDPVVDLARNRDFADRPIMPDQNKFGPPTPDSQRYWSSVSPHWKAVTDTLKKVSGGDDVVPGAIDMSPETLEYLGGVFTGAAGSFFLDRMGGLVEKVATGQEITANDLPLARKIVGGAPKWQDKSSYYARLAEIDQVEEYAKEYREGEGAPEGFAENNEAMLSLQSAAKTARKQMSIVRKAKRKLEAEREDGEISGADYREERKAVDEREADVITSFNTAWVETMKSR